MKKILSNLGYFFWKNFSICSFCNKRRAVWYYAPGSEKACEECVPRGCSCTLEIKPEVEENAPEDFDDRWEWEGTLSEEDYYYALDKKGRKIPCVEWVLLRD